jgi:hypothetical protein
VENLARIAVVLDVRFEWLATGRGQRDYDPSVVDELPGGYAPELVTLDREEREVLAVLAQLPPTCRSRLVDFLRSIPACAAP